MFGLVILVVATFALILCGVRSPHLTSRRTVQWL